MKCIAPVLFVLIFSTSLSAQKIIYSDIIREDNPEINFEILGKVGVNYVIYKNVRWKHMLAIYNENMILKENARINFIPDKTFNIDFILYPDFFYMVYQYQKNNTIWCKAVKLSNSGKKLSEPVTLDTSRLRLVADRKIYNTVFSEDKKHILVYKMQRKNDNLSLVTKLYDAEFNLKDSTRQPLPFDFRRDIYSDIVVDNSGTFLFTKEYRTGKFDNVNKLDVYIRQPLKDTFTQFPVSLQEKYIDEVKIKIDNLNNNYILNSLFSKERSGDIHGLFTGVIERNNPQQIRTAFNMFSDSMRSQINSQEKFSNAFNNLFLRNTIVKKDGGFLITAEDYYTQATSSASNMRRYDNLYNSPYYSNYDYYLNSPSYSGFYRPLNSGFYVQSLRYYYDDIVILSVDSSLQLKWNSFIHKKQVEDEQDNFLSYASVNAGGEIHFLFSDSKKTQVINNHSILPGGQIKRYATLKSYEAGYEFMPKLAKQVGARQVLIPCLYKGSIAFAKIDFSN
ncbi:MAG: hypothetical protein WKF35_12610 [Ferruginibacter sp.]